MKKLFTKVIDSKNYVIVISLIFLVYCLWSLPALKVDAVPDISSVQVMVNAKTGSLSSEQIEKSVTQPIEMELAGLPHVKELRSLTKYGLSQTIVVFEDGVDIYFARQVVSEKLQNVSGILPPGITSELAPITTGLGEVLMWTVDLKSNSPLKESPLKEQLQYLRRVQEYVIKPALKSVPGIAEIDTNGGYSTEIHLNFTPQKLSRFGLSTADLLKAVDAIGTSFSGGYIQSGPEHLTVSASVPAKTLDEIRELAVKVFPNGQVLKLGQVCDVRIDGAPRVGAATSMGEQTVLGTVLMRLGENSRAVSRDAREKLLSLRLPEDVSVEVVYDRSYLVKSTISTVVKNLLEGAGLVIFVLFLLLANIRASVVVSLAIPFSMLFALKGMGLFNISANLMSLGAIDFGLLVDASVVMVENFLRRSTELKKNFTFEDKIKLVIDSCSEVAKPVIFGLVIIMLVYIPILALEGIEGKMFAPMAYTVLMALGASLIVALVLIPVFILFFIKPESDEHKPSAVFHWIEKKHELLTHKIISNKKPAFIASGLFLTLSLFVLTQIGSDFIPQLDEGDMIIGLVRNSKQNIEASVADQILAEKELIKFQEVEKVFSRLGTPESATDPMSPNFADTFVILKKDRSLWRKENGHTITKDKLFELMRDKLQAINSDQEISANQPIEMRFNEMLEGSRADITLRIIGPDLEQLLLSATESKAILEKISGAEAVEFDALTGLTKTPHMDVTLQSATIAQYDLTSAIVANHLQAAMAGMEVGKFTLDGRQVPIVYHLDESIRNDLSAIKSIPVSLPNGGNLPLAEFAHFDATEKVTTIARRWGLRYSAVSVYLAGRDINSFFQEAQKAVEGTIKLPAGYHFEWGGQFENLKRARAKLMILVPMILAVIFFLLLKSTSSWSQSLVIFSAVPFGLAGGICFLFARGIHMSVSAAVGFIALSGIVILNSVVLVAFINELVARGIGIDQAVDQGVQSRLRPILMTALVAGFGFLPMAFGSGLGSEVQRPLATVVVGGLITSTFLTLYLMPLLLKWQLKRFPKK